MKRFFLFFLLFTLALAGLIYFVALPKAKTHIESLLKDSGFSYAQASEVHFRPTGLIIRSINIDAEGFSRINNLKANIYWPTYFYKKRIDSLIIDQINIISGESNLSSIPFLKRKLDLDDLDKHQIKKLSINQISWDFPLFNYAIRVEAVVNVTTNEQEKNISIDLNANQHELSFSSKWEGKIASNGDSFIDSTIDDFQLNLPSFNLHRSNGWLSYKKEKGETKLSGQIEAGSGSILGLPTKNISFIIGKNEEFYPLIIRAYAAGMEDVRLSSDIQLAKDTIHQNGQMQLSIPNFQKFLDFLKLQKLIEEAPITSSEPLNITISLMPKRRFADGPLPFKIKIMQSADSELDGTLLIYPDTLAVRGTLTTNDDFIGVIKSLTTIKDSQIKEKIIHLDTNLKELML
jgi:hypothetical protein